MRVLELNMADDVKAAAEEFGTPGVTGAQIQNALTEVRTMHQQFLITVTLAQMTGMITIPNVFVAQESIGGGAEVSVLDEDGELERLLRKSGALDEDEST